MYSLRINGSFECGDCELLKSELMFYLSLFGMVPGPVLCIKLSAHLIFIKFNGIHGKNQF